MQHDDCNDDDNDMDSESRVCWRSLKSEATLEQLVMHSYAVGMASGVYDV